MNAVIDFFQFIIDMVKALISLVQGVVSFFQLIFSLVPAQILGACIALLTVCLLYKILGRENQS